jgi:hypothetical protein
VKRIGANAKDKSNSRFLHYGGKCAAFGRNDVFVVVRRSKQLQKQQQISPLRRQSAPPSVEMTIFGWRDFAQ